MSTRDKNVKTAGTHIDDGVILMDLSSLKPLAFDVGAVALLNCADDIRSSGKPCSIPDEIVKAIDNARPSELSLLRMPFRVGKQKYMCRAYLLEYADPSSAKPIVALHLHRSSSSGEAVDELAAEYDLTQREQEALLGISAGLTCKEVAERMNISPNTVKAYLRLIMVKMGVTRRAGIMGKLLEQTATGGSNGADRGSMRSGYSAGVKNGNSTNGSGGSHRNGAEGHR
jgi:DNA-binding CsgD family transcriptional regulator